MSPSNSQAGENTHPVKAAIAVCAGAAGLIIGIVLIAHFAIGTHATGATVASAHSPEATQARIKPLVSIAVNEAKDGAVSAGSSAPLAVAAAVVVPAPIPVNSAAINGESIFKSACIACHGAGIAGAPKAGDKSAWTPRVAQGKAVLYGHAVAGFQGKSGVMPAKGGNANLKDAEVTAAVDYMLSLVK